MKRQIFLFLSSILLIVSMQSNGQALITKKDSISLAKDTLVKLVIPRYRGNIQWQKSTNGVFWNNMSGNINDTLKVKPITEAMYRAVVHDGTCIPVYSDTVGIVTKDTISSNFIVPSNSGLNLVSDSAKISSGKYIYVGVTGTSNFEPGKVIIDEQSGGTIRKITEVIQKGDTITTITEPATMEDLFMNTSFKLSTAMVYPTQNLKNASLAEIETALTDKDGFIHPVEVIYESPDGVRLKSASIFTGRENVQGGTLYMHKDWSGLKFYDLTGSFNLPNKKGIIVSYSGNVKSYISEGYFTFDPEFKFEYEFDRPRINWHNFKVSTGEITKFKFYSDRSLIDFKNILAFESTIGYEFGKEWTLVPKIINAKFKFSVGGIPLWVDIKIDINCSLTAGFSGGAITIQGFQNTNYITIGAGYDNKQWYTIKNIEKTNQVFASNSGFLNSGIRFEIHPSVEMKLYSIVGPYFKVGPYVEYEANLSLAENWDKKIDLGVDANVGVSVDVFGREIASLNAIEWNFFNSNLWKAPQNLTLVNGNNQSAQTGTALPLPIQVKVTDSKDQPLSNAQVHFLPSSGSVLQAKVKTDANGLASTSYTLSANPGEHVLIVYLMDGKDQEISGCSLIVKATALSTNLPTVTTTSITAITQTTATGGGNVTADGGATVTTRGVVWSASQNPTIENKQGITYNGTGTGSFTSNLTGLTANTPYYVRAYATNSQGTAYGSQVTFTTSQAIGLPTVTTNSITDIAQTTATGGGNVTADGGATVTARGVVWSASQNPTIENKQGITYNGTGTGSFTSNLTSLTPNTPYFVRAYATNNVGTAYGSQVTFTTSQAFGLPTVTTNSITDIAQTTATGGGNVTSDGGATVTAKGVCWNTTGNPTTANSKTTDGTGTGSFTSSLTGLTANTPYYVRAYATNSQGTAYGSQVTFTTASSGNPTGTFTDSRDGKVYKWVQIGTQTWMAENLAYIAAVSPPTVSSKTEKYYYVYGYIGSDLNEAKSNTNYIIYGVLYNWPAALTACPSGWHLPGDAEWTTLTDNLGGESIAGGKLKEMGTTHWVIPNSGATNETGFSAIPAGYRYSYESAFYFIGYRGLWWSFTENDPSYAWSRVIIYDGGDVGRLSGYKEYGLSVRCVKD